jgi:hypothetical protein
MQAQQRQSETISLDYDKFLSYVDRRFEEICGLSIHDVEDFDFNDFYPGETAEKIVYAQAVRDAASACLTNAAGSSLSTTATKILLGVPEVVCEECGKKFDLSSEVDAEQYEYGHDCEV